MQTQLAVVAAAVAAAFFFAASSALKHISAESVTSVERIHFGHLARFVRATVTHRYWLAGIACDAVALTLQVIALHLGALAVVQPILISGLVFALLMRRLSGPQHVTGRQLAWAGLMTLCLASFVVLAGHGGTGAPSDVDRLPALVAALVGATLAAGCVALGRRYAAHGGSAALLGIAVGLVYAATAALLKALSDIAVRSPVHLLVSWQLYATLVAGAAGLLLNQLAFQAGPLAVSLPATASVDPLASIVIGVAVYDEHVDRLAGTGALLVVLFVGFGVSVIQLARTAPTADGDSEARHTSHDMRPEAG